MWLRETECNGGSRSGQAQPSYLRSPPTGCSPLARSANCAPADRDLLGFGDPEPIEYHRQQAISRLGVPTELPDDLVHANHQVHHVLNPDIVAHSPNRLGSDQKRFDRLVELTCDLRVRLMQALAAGGHDLDEVLSGLKLHAQSSQIVEQGSCRVADLK